MSFTCRVDQGSFRTQAAIDKGGNRRLFGQVVCGTLLALVSAFVVVGVADRLFLESTLPSPPTATAHSTQASAGELRVTEVGAPGGVVVLNNRATTEFLEQRGLGVVAAQDSALPAEVLLADVPAGRQSRSLNCEFQTASDLAWYFGLPYTWDEIFRLVGHDPGGNPHKGFVGRSLDDPPGGIYPDGYGVYAEPIAASLDKIGLDATVHYGESRTWLQKQISAGRPVMVWATADMIAREPELWVADDGEVVKGVRHEHTFLAVGYDASGVWLNDPWDGKRHYHNWNVFLPSWDSLDRMSLVVVGKSKRPPAVTLVSKPDVPALLIPPE